VRERGREGGREGGRDLPVTILVDVIHHQRVRPSVLAGNLVGQQQLEGVHLLPTAAGAIPGIITYVLFLGIRTLWLSVTRGCGDHSPLTSARLR
jgi:hypothetical protein